MMSMANVWNKNKIFLTLSLILLGVLGLALICIPKGELHLLLCDRHTPARDIFYRYYTTVAEWFPYLVCIALLLFSRIGNGVLGCACMLGSALTTQIAKHIINAPRPVTWFAANMPDVQLPLVEGVRMNAWFSFPSGHTTSFFSLAFVVCVLLTSPATSHRSPTTGLIQILLFVLAALGGYSRIYLSQHFAMDVFGGILVGIFVSVVAYAVLLRFEDKKWYNYRLFTLKKHKNTKK